MTSRLRRDPQIMSHMSNWERSGWRLAVAAVVLAIAVLAAGFVLLTDGLAAAASAATLAATLVSLATAVTTFATRGRPEPQGKPQAGLADSLRFIAHSHRLSRVDLRKQLRGWGRKIDPYLDGREIPEWQFVTDFLKPIEPDPARREMLMLELRPAWEAAQVHKPSTARPLSRRASLLISVCVAVLIIGIICTAIAIHETNRSPRVSPEPIVAKIWSYPTRTAIQSMPAVADGSVLVGGDNGTLYSFDAATGGIRWAMRESGSFRWSSPELVNGVVYIGNADGTVYALSAATGTGWHYSLGAAIGSALAVANGVIYASAGNAIKAVDATTHKVRWTYTAGVTITGSSPVVTNGMLYVGDADGMVYAINADSGKPRWSYPTGAAIESTPVVTNGTLYVGNDGNAVYAIKADSGKPRWSYPTGAAIASGPVVSGGVVYVGCLDGTIYALRAASGAIDWRFITMLPPTSKKSGSAGVPPAAFLSNPPVVGGVIYAVDVDGRIYALKPSIRS